jgi:hypothetical protein
VAPCRVSASFFVSFTVLFSLREWTRLSDMCESNRFAMDFYLISLKLLPMLVSESEATHCSALHPHGCCVKLESKGPTCKMQTCGEIWRHSAIEFGTMVNNADNVGCKLCGNYFRAMPLGRILKGTKLNELPQLVNVVKTRCVRAGPGRNIPNLSVTTKINGKYF